MSEPCKPLPYVVNVKAGQKQLWCACGLSARQPYCDFSHLKVGAQGPVEFSQPVDITVALCGCKRTAAAPYCDGAHALVLADSRR